MLLSSRTERRRYASPASACPATEPMCVQPLPDPREQARREGRRPQHLRRQARAGLDKGVVRVRKADDREIAARLPGDRSQAALREPRRDVPVASAVNPEGRDPQLSDPRDRIDPAQPGAQHLGVDRRVREGGRVLTLAGEGLVEVVLVCLDCRA